MSLVSVLGCGTWFFPIEEQLCYLKHWGIDWRRLRREPPAVRFQAQQSNELWQCDISPSDLKHLKSPAWVDEAKGQPTLMLYSIVDVRRESGMLECVKRASG